MRLCCLSVRFWARRAARRQAGCSRRLSAQSVALIKPCCTEAPRQDDLSIGQLELFSEWTYGPPINCILHLPLGICIGPERPQETVHLHTIELAVQATSLCLGADGSATLVRALALPGFLALPALLQEHHRARLAAAVGLLAGDHVLEPALSNVICIELMRQAPCKSGP